MPLTLSQYQVLRALLQHAGAALPLGELARYAWGDDDTRAVHYLGQVISDLREHLGQDAHLLRTSRHFGVLLDTPRTPTNAASPRQTTAVPETPGDERSRSYRIGPLTVDALRRQACFGEVALRIPGASSTCSCDWRKRAGRRSAHRSWPSRGGPREKPRLAARYG